MAGRFGFLVAGGGLSWLLLGCSPPQAGVHVVVTMADEEFDAAHPFDHLTVEALVGARRARACLFEAVAETREVEDAAAGETACADLREAVWVGAPSAATWQLQKDPRG
ncbi:MAG: hypothetical protein R3F14_06495 [Polyangiaceae bacterium]